MKKSVALFGLMIGLSLVISGWGLVAPVQAAPIEIRFAHGDSPDVYTSKKAAASVIFKNIVEMATLGNVSVKLFPSAQLGGERELVEATKLGTLQICMVSAAISSVYKEAQVLDIPYLFSSSPVAYKVMDGWFGKELADDCLKKTGMRVLAYGETGFRHFGNSVRPIKAPADVKGMKIRVMESPVYINMMKSFSAAPTPIPFPETYTAIQQKVVDGLELPVSAFVMGKFNEVLKYITLDGHSYSVDFILINENFYKKLPIETQNILKTASVSAAVGGRGIQLLDNAIGVAKLQEKGVEIYTPDSKERALFKAAAQKPVIDFIEKQVGKVWVDKAMKATKEAEGAMRQ